MSQPESPADDLSCSPVRGDPWFRLQQGIGLIPPTGLGLVRRCLIFSPVIFAMSAAIASRWEHEVLYHDVDVHSFMIPLALFVVAMLVLYLGLSPWLLAVCSIPSERVCWSMAPLSASTAVWSGTGGLHRNRLWNRRYSRRASWAR